MLLIGLISVLPMIGYDIILNRMLEQKQNPRYLFETSWLINTINNIAGFGGFVVWGFALNYMDKEKSRNVIQALSKLFLFLMAGLSIYSLLSFLIVFFHRVAPF